MACGCPVVTSDRSAMPETAGGAALLADPDDPASIAARDRRGLRRRGSGCAQLGPARAAQFTWAATAERTLEVYREVHARTGRGRPMRILVTGGAGFIGSHTCDRLVARGPRGRRCSMR